MAYNVKISPVAKADVRNAVAYYKKEASLKVAQNFVEDYELTLKKIVQNPFPDLLQRFSRSYVFKISVHYFLQI